MKFASVNGFGGGSRDGDSQCISQAGDWRICMAISPKRSRGGLKSWMTSSKWPGLQRTVT